jgi:hypothetical protein
MGYKFPKSIFEKVDMFYFNSLNIIEKIDYLDQFYEACGKTIEAKEFMIAYHNMTISILKDLLLGKVINGQS